MSIQRYSFTAQRRLECHKEDEGDYVLYTDHLTDKEAELYNFLSTLSDIRAALGVGDKPMLDELAGIVGTMKRERDEAVEALRDVLTLFAKGFPAPEIARARAALARIEGGRK